MFDVGRSVLHLVYPVSGFGCRECGGRIPALGKIRISRSLGTRADYGRLGAPRSSAAAIIAGLEAGAPRQCGIGAHFFRGALQKSDDCALWGNVTMDKTLFVRP